MLKNLFFVLFFTSFVTIAFAQPKWVKHVPVDSDYYIGIGSASKNDENYIDKARDIALSRIASNIAVTISSETNSHILEQAGIVNEAFESNISSYAKAKLQGYEVVDKWEDKNDYYVYYRLSKASYKETMKRNKLIAKREAASYYSLGKRALSANEINTALTYFAKAAKAIGNFRGLGMTNVNEGNNSYLDIDVYVELNKILSAIQLKCNPVFLETSLYASSFETVIIHATYMDENGQHKNLAEFPLTAQLPDKSLEYSYIQSTNAQGITMFQAVKLLVDENIKIKLVPNIWMLAGIKKSKISFDPFAEIKLPTAIVSINIEPVNVYIRSQVSQMGQTVSNPVTYQRAKQKLSELNWLINELNTDTDFIFQINANIRNGVEIQGLYTAFAQGTISLIKRDTGDEIFNKTLTETKGIGGNFKVAGTKALENLSDGVEDEIELMVTQIKNK